ncbi:MAG: SPASM domain-containing protein [Bacteroidales bacterium]|jgi:MoaA/NifB/PqqE/SkfB family radical SAM enzyme|nr:SPASM domain-containing protein [Bacteroidales bacterium]
MTIRYDGEVIPCCEYRIGEQYVKNTTPISLGNVFKESVKTVWNNKYYKIMRKYVFDPSMKPCAPFCVGCQYLFNVDRQEVYGLDKVNGGLTILKKNLSPISEQIRNIG